MKLSELTAIDRVQVYKNREFAGTLSRTLHGACFSYDQNFSQRIQEKSGYGVAFSLSPRQQEHTVSGINLHPFFAGLLPEGLRLKALKKNLKTSEDDLFTMLLALGTNCIGDVYVRHRDVASEAPYEAPKLSETSFWELFEHSISSFDLKLRENDPGIPGAIPKLSASMISFPLKHSIGTKEFILKLEPAEYPLIIQNEHFFMQMAKECGLSAASTRIVYDRNNVPALLVERFDRVYDQKSKGLLRLHQEDSCQFLNRYPHDKYRLSMREIGEGIARLSTSPLIEVRRLIELYLFSYLIGNGDLHGKNISLLNTGERIELAPAYDLLSTLPYGDRKMALKMGAKDDDFSHKDVLEFSRIFELPEKAVRSLVERLIVRSAKSLTRVDEIGFDKKTCTDLKNTFEKRAEKLQF